MLPRVFNLGRLCAVAVLPALVFLTPLAATVRDPSVSGVLALLVAGVLLAGLASPSIGAALVVILLPLTELGSALAPGGPARPEIVDALVIALAAGVSLRWLRWRGGQTLWLAAPAAVLAAAVVTSTIVELHTLQVIAPRRPLLDELWTHLTTTFLSEPRTFPVLHDGLRWLAWLSIAVAIEGAREPLRVLWRAWIVAGMVGATLTALRVAEIVGRLGDPTTDAATDVLSALRVTALQPDLNAAGSYFLLFLVPAVVAGVRRRVDWLALASVPLVGFALAMTRSRSAIAAGLIVAAAASLAPLLYRAAWARLARRVVVVGIVGAAAIVGVSMMTSTSNATPARALGVRAEMAEVALTAAARYPVFGVGLGDYIRSTRRFITPDLPLLHRFAPEGENAHNNFLQIAVELGIPAGLVFLWLVGPTVLVGFGRRGAAAEPWVRGLALGLAAFLVTALFGHPLLISQVGATFFVGLGMAAGGMSTFALRASADRQGSAPIPLAGPPQGAAPTRAEVVGARAATRAAPTTIDAGLALRTQIALAGVAFYVLSLGWRL